MNLSKDEKMQSGMIKARKFLDGRLADLRKQNDEIMSDAERSTLLGEIWAVKALLKFMNTDKIQVPDDTQFHD